MAKPMTRPTSKDRAEDPLRIHRTAQELAGDRPTVLERHLAGRLAIARFVLGYYEALFTQQATTLSPRQGLWMQQRISYAHCRFLAACRTLAVVRKMALPSLMLNVVYQQQIDLGAGAPRPPDPDDR